MLNKPFQFQIISLIRSRPRKGLAGAGAGQHKRQMIFLPHSGFRSTVSHKGMRDLKKPQTGIPLSQIAPQTVKQTGQDLRTQVVLLVCKWV